MAASSTTGTDDLLSISDLTIRVDTPDGQVALVEDFSLRIGRAERVALVGESGSGKSVTARAVLRVDPQLHVSGRIDLGGENLLESSEKRMRAVRGRRIGMVFQDPMNALNPLMTVGEQVAEPMRGTGLSRSAARERARSLLTDLGVPDAQRRMRAYPHEFSGGMRQRVVMAMALSCEPELLIADEPTTALDVRVQEQVLDLLDAVADERSLGVLLITHDLGIVAGFADRVAVMYGGRKVHEDVVGPLFADPRHPYTAGLLAAVPRIEQRAERLPAIPGSPPPAAARPAGCAFHPRCPLAVDVCRTDVPPLVNLGHGSLACHVVAGQAARSEESA